MTLVLQRNNLENSSSKTKRIYGITNANDKNTINVPEETTRINRSIFKDRRKHIEGRTTSETKRLRKEHLPPDLNGVAIATDTSSGGNNYFYALQNEETTQKKQVNSTKTKCFA